MTDEQETELAAGRNLTRQAARRLGAAHNDPSLTAVEFMEVLETYLLATRAYHCTIRNINEATRQALEVSLDV